MFKSGFLAIRRSTLRVPSGTVSHLQQLKFAPRLQSWAVKRLLRTAVLSPYSGDGQGGAKAVVDAARAVWKGSPSGSKAAVKLGLRHILCYCEVGRA